MNKEAAPGAGKLAAVSTIGLKAVLALLGAAIIVTGLNRAFGGIATLGWQGPTDFLEVLNAHAYLVQDNHTRFLGGVWIGIGLMLLIAPFNLRTLRPVLNFIFALIFLGGLTRFTNLDTNLVFGPDILPSLAIELVGMPLLFVWLRSVARSPAT